LLLFASSSKLSSAGLFQRANQPFAFFNVPPNFAADF
jgi:hypothetical protein